MTNRVTEIVFPLIKSYPLYQYELHSGKVINDTYMSICIEELKKVVKAKYKHGTGLGIGVGGNVIVTKYPDTDVIRIKPRGTYPSPDVSGVFVPELYQAITYKWLLEQVKTTEKGSTHTECCLLHHSSLIVFNTETSHNITKLSILTGVLSKILRELLKDGEGFKELHNHAVGKYFTDFITVDKENLHKVLLSDKSKLLIADMEMQSM